MNNKETLEFTIKSLDTLVAVCIKENLQFSYEVYNYIASMKELYEDQLGLLTNK